MAARESQLAAAFRFTTTREQNRDCQDRQRAQHDITLFLFNESVVAPGHLVQNLFRFGAADQNGAAVSRQLKPKILVFFVVIAGTHESQIGKIFRGALCILPLAPSSKNPDSLDRRLPTRPSKSRAVGVRRDNGRGQLRTTAARRRANAHVAVLLVEHRRVVQPVTRWRFKSFVRQQEKIIDNSLVLRDWSRQPMRKTNCQRGDYEDRKSFHLRMPAVRGRRYSLS